jgi:hypothetical protein
VKPILIDYGTEKEEIRAPSQIMAMSSPYFKQLFYPSIIGDSMEKEINGMQPKTFRKILDYLFRGRVPLSSIEDAWKVKVAGRDVSASKSLRSYAQSSCNIESILEI